jgi:uncharacterized LabA/DUF88 family protein
MRTNVYIDGFNLYYGCLKGSPYRWLDVEALCGRLLPKDEINRIRYFTARIAGRTPTDHGPVHQDAYLRALATLAKTTVHEGEFYVTRTTMPLANPTPGESAWVQVIKTEEKGSDVAMASYLMLDAMRGECEASVIVTNDSDLREPIRLVREELGLVTGVINPHPPYRRSRALTASFFKQIRRNALAQSQLPTTLTDANGRKITKPQGW